MNSAELEHRAEQFWAETGLADGFPRDIEQAIPLKLPVSIVKLPVVTIRSIAQWLRRHNRSPVFPLYHRDLMGCLYADAGQGFIFVCSADEPEEQRFTLAHDAAHFLVDYWWPRQLVIQAMGSSIVEVLDGHRPADADERASAILAHLKLGAHWHLLPRQGNDPAGNRQIQSIEDRADDLGLELVAPRCRVLGLLGELPPRQRSQRNSVCRVLGNYFGLPGYVFEKEVTERQDAQTPSFLEDVRRVLRR